MTISKLAFAIETPFPSESVHRRTQTRFHPLTPQDTVEEGLQIQKHDAEGGSKKRQWARRVTSVKNTLILPNRSSKLLRITLLVFLMVFMARLHRDASESPQFEKNYPRMLRWDAMFNTGFRINPIKPLPIHDPDTNSNNQPPQLQIENRITITSENELEEPSESCQPMHQWMKQTFPSCNNLHEVQIAEGTISFINCGGSRCAFRINDIQGNPLVLKTQKYSSSFSSSYYSAARTDALAMERLTKSPYVSDLFSTCGTSQLVEYSGGGNIHDLVKLARLEGQDKQPPLDRLKIAYQIATAVADMHSFESDGVPSLTHNDLCCHQFILFDGVYKLTDFHLSTFLQRDQYSHQVCNETAIGINSVLMKLRAPEEQFIQRHEERVVQLDKIDVYMMGNVMFYVLTKKWLFQGLTTLDATKRMVKQHFRSKFPKALRNSDDPAIQAVIAAIQMCWTHEPSQRPAAREVSNLLKGALEKILGTTPLGVVKVSIPPLPTNYDYSDSDFYVNLGGEL